MKIRALIVDDEFLARKLIELLLEKVSEIEVIGLCKTGREAVRSINKLKPDIVFLDIQLKDATGFEVLEKITVPSPLIIFVTAFDSYAIKAFEIFAFDYLLKPYNERRFYVSVQKAIASFNKEENVVLQETVSELLTYMNSAKDKSPIISQRKIPIPSRNKTVFVDTNDIIYIKASNYYVEIFTNETMYLLRESMSNLMNSLDVNKFVRIHRSSIVNMAFIEELVSSDYGEIDVKMSNYKLLRVSKSYRKEFLIRMGIRK